MDNLKSVAILPALAICLLFTASCRDDRLSVNSGNKSIIGISLSQPYAVMPKSGEETLTCIDSIFVEDVNGQDIIIEAFESDFTDYPFLPGTKGTVVNDSIINIAGSKFIVDAWLGSENRQASVTDFHFIKSGEALKAADAWSLRDSGGNEFKWMNAVPTTFWSYYPATVEGGAVRTIDFPGNTAQDVEQKTLSFTYSLGTAVNASNQKDLLFAYNLQSANYASGGRLIGGSPIVDIKFFHALSAIRFDISALKEIGCQIKTIILKGVAGSGTCSVEGQSEGVTFTWTPTAGDTKDCSQSFLAEDFTADSVTESYISGDKVPNSLQSIASNKIFFLIPQAIKGQGIQIGIVYDDKDGVEQTKYMSLDHDASWLPGKYYTYKLSLKSVEVSITDDVDGDVKDNLVIKNIGNQTAYIRAMITGYWVNADKDIIVSNWDPEDTTVGTFVKGSGYSNWTKGADGFYYHNAPVPAGQNASTLFTSYTVTNRPDILEDDNYLEFNIVTQSVPADEGKASAIAAWGTTAASYLN